MQQSHMNNNLNYKNEAESYVLMDEEDEENSKEPSLLSFSPSVSSFDSFQTSSKDFNSSSHTTTTPTLSRMESESGISCKTFLVRVPVEEQIERDASAEEQLAKIRREIEEIEMKAVSSNELNRRRSRKDLVKVPLQDGLPVALHPQDSDKETCGAGTGGEQTNEMFGGMRIVDEDHRNYILMYDMLTGIRTSVSRCQAKPSRPLTHKDFHGTHKMAFDLTGNEETPSSRYDFKFKDYAPWVFRSLREHFSIDAADYLVKDL